MNIIITLNNLIQEAKTLTGIESSQELIEVALHEPIHSKKKIDLFELAGLIDFDGDFNYKFGRKLRDSYPDFSN